MQNKFWNRKEFKETPETFILKSSNRVQHREYGDIPGILEAQDIFVSIPLEEMRIATGMRAHHYCGLVDGVINGDLKFTEFKNHPFHSRDARLSVIANPSKPYKKDW